jgi:hypothetical protein
MQMLKRMTPFRLALLAAALFIGLVGYGGAYLLFGPWDLGRHVTARATSHNGKLHAEVYRQGFGYSWQVYCRVLADDALLFDRVIDGLDTIDEPGLYYSEAFFDRTDSTLYIGPHASHQTRIRDYCRLDVRFQRPPITSDVEP